MERNQNNQLRPTKNSNQEGEINLDEEKIIYLPIEDLPKFDEIFPKLTQFLKKFPEL
jgi:hypothetical protein